MDEIIINLTATIELQCDVIRELKAQVETLTKQVKENTDELEYIRKTY